MERILCLLARLILYWFAAFCVLMLCLLLSLILTVKYLAVRRFSFHVLLYRMAAVVLCSRLLMLLYS